MPPDGMRRSSEFQRDCILLVGSDMAARSFPRDKTVRSGRHGAGIVSQYVLSAEQELILRRRDTDKEAEVRIVGQLGSHGESHTYGVAFLDAEMDLWGVDFPSMTDFRKEASRVLLQCCSCQGPRVVQQSDMESDVYLRQRRDYPLLQEMWILNDLENGLLGMLPARPFRWKTRRRKPHNERSPLRPPGSVAGCGARAANRGAHRKQAQARAN